MNVGRGKGEVGCVPWRKVKKGVRSWISHFPLLASRGLLAKNKLAAVFLFGEEGRGRTLGEL